MFGFLSRKKHMSMSTGSQSRADDRSYSHREEEDCEMDHTPNAETIEAIEEARAMEKDPSLGRTYDSFEELLKELRS